MPPVTRATSTTQSGNASEAAVKAESPPADPKPPKVVDVDPDGDLFLDVAPHNATPVRFRVCSGALRRQSPVWKTMLSGPWLESKPTNGEDWIIQLPEDPAYPMLIILNIIHGRFYKLPQNIRLPDLGDILVLINKYDMTSIVRPWCAQWIAVARGSPINKLSTSSRLSTPDMVKSLYVAWELGDEKLFALRLEDLALRSRMDKEGRLSYAALVPTHSNKSAILNDENHLGPQDALDTIRAIRKALLERLIAPVHKDLDARMKAEPCCKVGDTGYARMLCDAAAIGGMYRHMLTTRGGILTKPAADIEDSVVELASWLFPMMSKIPTVHGDERSRNSFKANDWECFPAPKYEKLCSKIQQDIPTVVAGLIKPSHKEYMAAQRAKSGLVMRDRIPLCRYWSWTSS